jgi:class 3 adenylate cyclase
MGETLQRAMALKKNFDQPDSRVEFGGVVQELVEIGDYTVGRTIQPPGWRWSTHIQPLVGGEWCMARHIGVVISGREATLFPDGSVLEAGPGDVYDIPPGHDGWVIGDEPCVVIDWSGLETWTPIRAELAERVLAGLLMTDIVGSTEEAARLGDAAWRHRLAEHHASVAIQLDRFHGREIDTAGDGVFAIFDGAARALQCAEAIREACGRQGIRIRAGVHVGEVELHGTQARGIAVHEVARIAAAAQPDEILVSESTRALSTGSGMRFEDRGEHSLKGLDGPRLLYRYDGVP